MDISLYSYSRYVIKKLPISHIFTSTKVEHLFLSKSNPSHGFKKTQKLVFFSSLGRKEINPPRLKDNVRKINYIKKYISKVLTLYGILFISSHTYMPNIILLILFFCLEKQIFPTIILFFDFLNIF